jgi:hypothetical protein
VAERFKAVMLTMPDEAPFVPTIFISYQTRSHRSYLPVVCDVIKEEGLRLWIDQKNTVAPTRLQGLELNLLMGLRSADALLLLSPAGPRNLTRGQKIKDIVDSIASMASIEARSGQMSTFAMYYWFQVKLYELLYGIDLMPRANESWQAWEARTGEQIGLEVVRMAITKDPNASPQPIDAHFVFTPDGLRDGLRRDVVPRLQRVRPRPKPDMLPGAKRFFGLLKSVGKTLLVTLIVVAAFVSVAVIAAFVFFPLVTTIAVATLAGLHGVSYLWRRWRR